MRFAVLASALALVTTTSALIACATAPAASSSESASGEDEVKAAPAATTAATDPVVPAPVATDVPVVTDVDAGVPVVVGGNDPGTLCAADSIREVEGNNDPTTATLIPTQSGSFCGRLEAGDIDHVTFIMPQSMRNFSYSPEGGFGNIVVEATAGGQPFNPNGAWPWAPGQPYTFKISSPGNLRPIDYRLRFNFNP